MFETTYIHGKDLRDHKSLFCPVSTRLSWCVFCFVEQFCHILISGDVTSPTATAFAELVSFVRWVAQLQACVGGSGEPP